MFEYILDTRHCFVSAGEDLTISYILYLDYDEEFCKFMGYGFKATPKIAGAFVYPDYVTIDLKL